VSALQRVAVRSCALQCVAVTRRTWRRHLCATAKGSVLQCVAVRDSMLQHAVVTCHTWRRSLCASGVVVCSGCRCWSVSPIESLVSLFTRAHIFISIHIGIYVGDYIGVSMNVYISIYKVYHIYIYIQTHTVSERVSGAYAVLFRPTNPCGCYVHIHTYAYVN